MQNALIGVKLKKVAPKVLVITNLLIIDLSFCFWFKVYNLKSSKILNFETNEKNGFRFTVQGIIHV